jgi:hypothetical protein
LRVLVLACAVGHECEGRRLAPADGGQRAIYLGIGGRVMFAAPEHGQQVMKTQEYSLFSVMGPHAGEDSDAILARKIADIRNAGRTFWVIRSHKAKPAMVQAIGMTVRSRSREPLCAFVAPSSPGGAVPTTTSSTATEYSADRCEWQTLLSGITPVTGQISSNTCALVFDQLCLQDSAGVDLWHYADFFDPDQPVRIQQGASTVGVVRGDTSTHPRRMKSHLRRIMAVGRLVEPFAVWLR